MKLPTTQESEAMVSNNNSKPRSNVPNLEMRQIPGYPNLFVSKEGDVLSCKMGRFRNLNAEKNNSVSISVDGVKVPLKVTTLIKKAYSEEAIHKRNYKLTEDELEFIRDFPTYHGSTSKLARILNVHVSAVAYHRKKLRRSGTALPSAKNSGKPVNSPTKNSNAKNSNAKPVTNNVKPRVRPIIGFPGYFITKQGVVWSVKRNRWTKLKTASPTDGNVTVQLRQDGKMVGRSVSLLVSKTYGTPAKKRGPKPSGTVKA
jgi:hypothetical protein